MRTTLLRKSARPLLDGGAPNPNTKQWRVRSYAHVLPYQESNQSFLRTVLLIHLDPVTSDTVMHRSKTNIYAWSWAAYLVATQIPGVSALELQKKLGIKRYETAFQLLHKLRAAMVRPDRDKIGAEWPLELDIVYVGGKHKSGVQGKTDQTPVIIAVEIRRREVREGLHCTWCRYCR